MDSIMSDLLLNPDEWPSNPDDFMDLFPLDTNMLFNDGSPGGSMGEPDCMNDITSSLINNLQNGFGSGTTGSGVSSFGDICGPLTLDVPEQAMSPMSSLGSDQEFHGFPSSDAPSMDGSGYEDEFMVSSSPVKVQVTSMGAVETKMELDEAMNEFNEFERNAEQQTLSSAASDSGLSSDHLDFDQPTDYEALSPALSSPGPSISERGGQNSPPRYIKPNPQPIQKSQTIPLVQQTSVPITTASTLTKAGKVYQTVKTVFTGQQQRKGLISPKSEVATGLVLNKDQIQTTQLTNGKELKIYRVNPVRGNQIVNVANGSNANKKVTLQLKNGTTTSATVTGKSTNGTVFLNNKNVILTSSPGNGTTGVRKIIRVQQQQQQNGRSILVPVSIQDLRTIKIVNSANLKTKSANIKLAAANLLQQSKQGLVQKNMVFKKEQLVVDDSDGAQNSDNESFVFEDIMHQSNSVIEQVERHQKQQQVVSDSDAEQDDDDLDESDISACNKPNAAGGYQKLILTTEEKRLLAKEGISLPTCYPLTKHEERELKRIRRKIRNKISAQDSRKRKKEYVDGLEERVKQCTEENQTLLKRIKILQSQNHDLMSQMKKIQSLLTKGTGKTTQPATCLMVLLLSMALVAVPNLKLGGSHQQQNIQDSIEMAELLQEAASEKTQVQSPQAQNRRSLLFDTKEQLGDALVDEEMNFDEIMSLNVNSLIASEHDYFSEGEPKAKKAKINHSLVDYEVDDDIWNGSSKMRIKLELDEKQFHGGQDHSSGFNIKQEVIVNQDLFEAMSKKSTAELYNGLDSLSQTVGGINKDISNIELLAQSSPTAGNIEDIGNKLNASQQIQQQNGKRKLLL